ncbi:unnamed protein product [Adineta ricciae]|uniref:Uncharacterized protein n=1 Tax=Adineta ricciae TaxID=249248 RepID=A0A814D155_ADIRI|nr:unnamed protein product [Adineta ricciae]
MAEITSMIQGKYHVCHRIVSSCKSAGEQLLARKPMSDIQIEIETENDMRRTLGWVQLTGIGLGCVIGIGIFTFSGQAAARYAGPAVIISFLLAGIVALLAALSFSEMAAMMSSSGSAYTYAYAALGEYWAWIVACNLAIMYELAASTVVMGWSKYVVHLVNIAFNRNVSSVVFDSTLMWTSGTVITLTGAALDLPAIAITVVITIILIVGIRQTATINLILVFIKVIILLIFVFVCCRYINVEHYQPFFPENQGSFDSFGVSGVLKGATFVFLAYVGFESIGSIAQEAKKPTRTLPVSIIGCTVFSMTIYVIVSSVMVGLVPYSLLDSQSPLSVAINTTPYGLWLSIIMDIGAIVSLATVALTMLLAQTRIFYAMAHDRLLPPIFARIYSNTKTPWISILISGTICALISGVCPIDILGETTSISALIVYFFVHISVIVMRYTHKNMPRSFRVPFGAWPIPTIGAALCVAFLINTSKGAAIRLAISIGIGNIIYFSYAFWHSDRRKILKRDVSTTSMSEFISTIEIHSGSFTNIDAEGSSVDETAV